MNKQRFNWWGLMGLNLTILLASATIIPFAIYMEWVTERGEMPLRITVGALIGGLWPADLFIDKKNN